LQLYHTWRDQAIINERMVISAMY